MISCSDFQCNCMLHILFYWEGEYNESNSVFICFGEYSRERLVCICMIPPRVAFTMSALRFSDLEVIYPR